MSWFTADILGSCFLALRAHTLRTMLAVSGIAVGIGSVILLSSLGEGARKSIAREFTQFGTNVIVITPGKVETFGIPGVLGGSTQKLTLDDAVAVGRLDSVQYSVPMAMGMGSVEFGGLSRDVYVYGTTADLPRAWKFEIGIGSFLPEGDPKRGASVVVLGPTLKRELFGEQNALGRFVRVAGTRLRVIGVMAAKGHVLGFDIDDAAYVPVATAMHIFDLEEVTEIDLSYAHDSLTDSVVASVRRVLMDRHRNKEDFTVTAQAAMLATFDNVLAILSLVVAGIAGISLLVGSVGVFTIMWITVDERVQEVGLMKAIGATSKQVQFMFLAEAVLVALVGGAIGLLGGIGLAQLVRFVFPQLAVQTPVGYVLAAVGVCFVVGLLAGLLPARRAAQLDPILALRSE